MTVQPIPAGYHTITPYICVKDCGKFLEFLKTAFDAEINESTEVDGKIMNSAVRVGTSMMMCSEAQEGFGVKNATSYMYVLDTDAAYKQAMRAGAISVMEPADQFYGDRNAGVSDVFGNQWWFATRIENVTPEEVKRRAQTHKR